MNELASRPKWHQLSNKDPADIPTRIPPRAHVLVSLGGDTSSSLLFEEPVTWPWLNAARNYSEHLKLDSVSARAMSPASKPISFHWTVMKKKKKSGFVCRVAYDNCVSNIFERSGKKIIQGRTTSLCSSQPCSLCYFYSYWVLMFI